MGVSFSPRMLIYKRVTGPFAIIISFYTRVCWEIFSLSFIMSSKDVKDEVAKVWLAL